VELVNSRELGNPDNFSTGGRSHARRRYRCHEWSDRLSMFFSVVELEPLDGVGHFTPVEAPEAFAAAIVTRGGISGRRA
jgi:pimeloyl-ACP methyl ester carboxylesterase